MIVRVLPTHLFIVLQLRRCSLQIQVYESVQQSQEIEQVGILIPMCNWTSRHAQTNVQLKKSPYSYQCAAAAYEYLGLDIRNNQPLNIIHFHSLRVQSKNTIHHECFQCATALKSLKVKGDRCVWARGWLAQRPTVRPKYTRTLTSPTHFALWIMLILSSRSNKRSLDRWGSVVT